MADGTTDPGPGAEDEFDRQLRALTDGSAGKALFRELSAAERAKEGARQAKQARKQAARQAIEAERAARRRARASGMDQRPDGADGGRPDGADGLRPDGAGGGGGGHGGLRAAVVLAACFAVVIGLTWLRFDHSTASGPNDTQPAHVAVPSGTVSGNTGPADTGPPNTGPAITAPQSPASPTVAGGPPADPFADTAARDWADGPAGIVIPPPAPTGGYSAAQVAAAYQTTKKLLTAAALDRPTLLGGAPTAFADLLVPQQRQWFAAGLDKTGLGKSGAQLSTRAIVTSFAPGSTRLIGSVIKVAGAMHAAAGFADGRDVLVIAVNYRFVYPVAPPRAPADWVRIVAEYHGSVDFAQWDPAVSGLVPWEFLTAAEAGARCDTSDGYVHPQYPNGPADKVQPSGAPTSPYSLSTQAPSAGCHAVTGP